MENWSVIPLLIAVALSMPGCGSDADVNDVICDEGATRACDCPEERRGLQVCQPGGTRWGVCSGCAGVDGDTAGADSDADGDTDTDVDGDTDTDADGDTDTDADGDTDTDADGDSDTDTDADSDGDTGPGNDARSDTETTADVDSDSDGGRDSDTVGDTCAYSDCDRAVCTDACCAGTICGADFFPLDYGYIENYCIPLCDAALGDASCKCGDVCVAYDDQFLCLPESGIVVHGFSSVAGADIDAAVVSEEFVYTALYNGHVITFDYFVTFFEAYELVVWAFGMDDTGAPWNFDLYIPLETIERGPGSYNRYDDGATAPNFYVTFYTFTEDMEQMWLAGVVNDLDAILVVEQACAPCAALELVSQCEVCRFSLEAGWFGIRSKLY